MESNRWTESPATSAKDITIRETQLREQTLQFLGGSRLVRFQVGDMPGIHAANSVRHLWLPYESLSVLLATFDGLAERDVLRVLGINARKLRRHRSTPREAMPSPLAGKTWQFARALARVWLVFGSKEKAVNWMCKPAIGLDGQRPIDLLQTIRGAQIVNDFLTRLEYGVYT